MPKRVHKECYEVSKEEAKYMSSTVNATPAANVNNRIARSYKKLEHNARWLQPQQISNETFNIKYRVVADGSEALDHTIPVVIRTNSNDLCDISAKTIKSSWCDLSTTSTTTNFSATTTPTTTSQSVYYENLILSPTTNYSSSKLKLSKNLILQKFFRSTERNYATYENLCTGCGYGVFEARGRLCNFCQYVVHGSVVQSESSSCLVSDDTNGNIYENICEKCSAIYSSSECKCCQVQVEAQESQKQQCHQSVETLFEVCEEQTRETETNCVTPAVTNTKPLGKREKKRFFHGLIGSLKRVKSNLSTSTVTPPDTPLIRSRPEIVHNVDGYDNVFRTQDTFDLDKICELKRTQTSSSDQHIYGRLKLLREPQHETFTLPATLSHSHDQLIVTSSVARETNQVASSDCLNTGKVQVKKRPRISKVSLLSFTKTPNKLNESKNETKTKKQSLYLVDNVCQWMTSLRYEIHYYQTFGLDDDAITLCNPKSIPAKNTLTYCLNSSAKAPSSGGVTNAGVDIAVKCENLDEFLRTPTTGSNHDIYSGNSSADPDDLDDDQCSNSDEELVTLRHPQYKRSAVNSKINQRSPVVQTLEQQMVQEFKRQIMAKQLQQRENNIFSTTTTTTKTTTTTVGAMTTTPTPTTITTRASAAKQRAKRQAIYLKIDETLHCNASNENSSSSKNIDRTVAEVNYSCKQQQQQQQPQSSPTASEQFVTDHGLASRRAAIQPIATSNTTTSYKRCGIYERDSEFVNDILSAFEQFLSRDSDSAIATDASSSTEVARGGKDDNFEPTTLKGEANQTPEIGTNTRQHKALSECKNIESPQLPQALAADDDDLQQQNDRELNKQISAAGWNCDENICAAAVVVVQPNVIASPSPFSATVTTSTTDRAFEQIFNVVELISDQTLSRSLNNVVIYYDKQLSVFLRSVRDCVRYRSRYLHWMPERLVRKYQRFLNCCARQSVTVVEEDLHCICGDDSNELMLPNVKMTNESKPVSESEQVTAKTSQKRTNVSSDRDRDGNGDGDSESDCKSIGTKNCVQITVKLRSVEKSTGFDQNNPNRMSSENNSALTENSPQVTEVSLQKNSLQESPKSTKTQFKPQVPQRDPKTCISSTTPPVPAKRESPVTAKSKEHSKMTVPTNGTNGATSNTRPSSKSVEDEEDIYQPIWKFKTVGEVQERYQTDADYFEMDPTAKSNISGDNAVPSILISTDVEDHGEWETDDEFMFATQLECAGTNDPDACSLSSSTVRSTRSGSSVSGSTITNDASSTTTIGSTLSASLMHHLFRNVGIFYSLSDRKFRAIIYDYDRVHASAYFAKRQTAMTTVTVKANNADIEKLPSIPQLERSPVPPPRTTSAAKTMAATNFSGGESAVRHRPLAVAPTTAVPRLQLLPDSVQAWKFMLLDVNYLEDEEDMIVSETEILRAQESKEDPDTRQNQQLNILQRFKSASSGNLIELPNEEDKKSIKERMRNKLQRGVFKLNVRSPKSEKKSRGIFWRAEATSLYLEDGMKPKYPIFGAPLENLELNQTTQPNVPRFVVDCVEYIERKDCIQQDGLYRASGNKVSVDELKQKLTESYIYDPKLLATDDIHTLTSLLKQFFRELGAPLIPQETYERLGRNLTDAAAIEMLRVAFDEMREPNRSTLQFLIKHLTNVAIYSSENRMPASNLAIVWGPCILSANQIEYDIARMNTLAKVLIENYDKIFGAHERLVC